MGISCESWDEAILELCITSCKISVRHATTGTHLDLRTKNAPRRDDLSWLYHAKPITDTSSLANIKSLRNNLGYWVNEWAN